MGVLMRKSKKNIQYYETGKFLLDISKLTLGVFVFTGIGKKDMLVVTIAFLAAVFLYGCGIILIGMKGDC